MENLKLKKAGMVSKVATQDQTTPITSWKLSQRSLGSAVNGTLSTCDDEKFHFEW